MNLKIDKKDDVILKILHYFITEENYRPVIINGLENEIWLENMENDLKLIRLNTNYIHNDEQLKLDTMKATSIMKSIKRSTMSFKMTLLNLLLDTGEAVSSLETKNVETIKINKVADFKKNKFVKEFFPKVSEAELSDKVDPIEFFKLTEDMNKKTIKNEKKLQKIFSPKKPVATYILIILNVLVYLYMVLYGKFEFFLGTFANNHLLVKSGEFYRLFTSMFLHADLIHLVFNMYALYCIGPQVERYYGKGRYLFIYFISGLFGSLFSCLFMSNEAYGVGASGAIFGLLGSIAYFTYYYRATIQGLMRSSVVPVIMTNLLIGLFIPNISVSAHIGGLIGGILVSMGIGIGDKGRRSDQINGAIVTVLMFVFMVYMILTN
jgi:rhomboid protease GluP